MGSRFRFFRSLQAKFLLGMCVSGLVLLVLTLLFALSWKFRDVAVSPSLQVVVIVCLLVLVVPGLLIHQSIVRRLRALMEGAERVSAGDLSETVDAGGDDEIGALAEAFNEMTSRMRETIGELSRSREFIEKVLDNIELGIVVIDRDFRVVTANRAYFENAQGTDGLAGKCCFEMNRHDYNCRMICPARTSFAERRAVRDVHRHVEDDGREVVVEIFATPLFDEQGEVSMVILVSKDITSRMQMERKLLRSDRMALVGQMASGLAHEIKNPIAGISAAMQIISQSFPEDDANREIFQEIQEQIQRMKRTLSDLLSYAKPRKPQFVRCEINDLIRRSVALMEANAKRQGVIVETDLEAGLPPCRADPDMIQQVLLNLFLNAVQAQPNGGRIQLSTALQDSADGFVVIVLKDQGPGIPSDVLKNIFDPFFTTKHTGTGLGLAISDQILDEHEGKLEIESALGQGTTCRVYLPAVR